MSPRSLDRYRHKRNSARTPEPFGVVGTRKAAVGTRRFVVQQHAARRMHWDFRLEIDGVLVSWAVPRGPAVDPKEKRLAVQTEDHPLSTVLSRGSFPPAITGLGPSSCGTAGPMRAWMPEIHQTPSPGANWTLC